ncbi:MAG: hypothetical protein U0520_03745 [Candidatus Saccharimonadales bacterium]
MADAVATAQYQNNKTMLAAFAGMLVAIPVVSMITVSVLKAQLTTAFAASQANSPATTQSIGASCEVPTTSAAVVSPVSTAGVVWGLGRDFGSVSGSFNQTNTSTTTNTTTTTIDTRNNGNTTVDSRFSGNTYTDNRWSGNTLGLNLNNGNTSTTTTNTANTNVSDNGNTYTDNRNSGNSTSSSSTTTSITNNVNTNVNSGNVVSNDNDGVDVL